MHSLPVVDGVLSKEQIAHTGDFLVSQQDPNGAMPWFRGGKLDPWDHVEAAMGLTLVGRYDEAIRALDWSAKTQRADGSWPMQQTSGVIEVETADTNQCAYFAVGVWHYHLVTGQVAPLARYWPTVEKAINFVVRSQQPSGAMAWALGPDRRWDNTALLTGSSSTFQAIECACLIAEKLGYSRPRWRTAGRRLRECLRYDRSVFADRARYSMDWYYPVMAGAVRDEHAHRMIERKWEEFHWPERGIRCVADQPWVTAAETCELIAALDAIGDPRAPRLFRDVQFLRDDRTGGYWTGANIPDDAVWPVEQTSWTAAAVLLAADALTRTTAGSGIFRDAGRWSGWSEAEESVW